MSGWTTTLLAGLARYLADNGVGTWHPDPTDTYPVDEIGIVVGAMPPEPERCIVLAAYPVSEDLTQADVTMGVQIRTRAGTDPTVVQDLDDAVFEVLHGAEHLDFSGIDVVQIYRRSSASLGQTRDTNARWEHTSNYYLDVMRPTPSRPY